MFLDKIMEKKLARLKEAKERLPLDELKKGLDKSETAVRSFKQAVSKPHRINLIAEIKRSSPSAGTLRGDLDPMMLAEIFEAAGADALSVLTEEDHFNGSLDYVNKARLACDLPVMRKDFIVDEYQLYESRHSGADSLLLIADLISEEEMRRFLKIANSLGMDAVVEVHSEEDLKKALSQGAGIIGINNRNLHTFEVKLATTERLIRSVPKDKVVISESGIKSYEDVMYLKSLGVNAVLIGEAFMRSQDIPAKVKEVMGYR